ncbi:MAG: hypothetical protein ACJ8FY_04760 [Gemmataceae bacterium]
MGIDSLHRRLVAVTTAILSLPLLSSWALGAESKQTLAFGATELRNFASDKNTVKGVADAGAKSGQAFEAVAPFQLETYRPLSVLKPGWYRLTLRVQTPQTPAGTERLEFAFWNPANTPDSFRYQTTFAPQEFAAPGQYGELTRTFHIGPIGAQYGMQLRGGWKGLRIATLKLEALPLQLRIRQVRTDKLLYGLKEKGMVNVSVENTTGKTVSAQLMVQVESGLDETLTIHDKEVSIPAPEKAGQASVLKIPLPPQSEYGHAIIATLRQKDEVVGTARDYFYVSDRPLQVGHFGDMQIANHYTAADAPEFIERMRRHYFPLYEIDFWAPDDYGLLVPPAGKDRWWSGQTLAQVSTESLKERIRLGHAQGMKVLGYADLRYDFGFRIAELFRQRPEFCDWDANNEWLAYKVPAVERQLREDDRERFGEGGKGAPKFKAEGVWALATGNPAVVDYHADQLARSTKQFDWDGWRYDDQYDYDASGVDMLGRKVPFPGMTNPVLVARLRSAISKSKPGMIYGHNMEWALDQNTTAPQPMPITTKPRNGDYYTELVRDGAMHLQERWTATMVQDHRPWKEVAENLFRLGFNARRWGGEGYVIAGIQGARPIDARYLAALNLAGMTHIAYDVQDDQMGYMRIACRYADLLYGDRLVALPEPEKVLSVDGGGKDIWWQRYVRYREPEPGHRLYFVHLVNPPRHAKIGEGDANPPDAISNVRLRWTLPKGWQVSKAYHLAGEGGTEPEPVYTSGPWAVTTDVVGASPLREKLSADSKGDATTITVPTLRLWSVVVLDCTGPKEDIAPKTTLDLPPIPDQPQPKPPATADKSYSADAMRPLTIDSRRIEGWKGLDPKSGKTAPLHAVDDSDTPTAKAIRCGGPIMSEFYNPGQNIRGGVYRFSFRLKTTVKAPADAALEFAAWCPPQKPHPWRVEQKLTLSDLTPDDGWKTYSKEVEMGHGWDNFGIQVKQGYDGLLIDQVTVEEVRRYPDSKQLALYGSRPWPKSQQLVAHKGRKVWYGAGLYHDYFQLAKALRGINGVTLVEAPHSVYREQRGFEANGWRSAQELASYDLVILANVDLKSLTLDQRDWLRGYVQAGGALWLLGGPYGLGRGCWNESDLLEPILPVKMHSFDLRPLGSEKPIPLRPIAGEIVQASPWEQGPGSIWLHELQMKKSATAHMMAGDHPVLVTGQAGKGRVAVLALAPLGDEPKGELVWWKWPGWTGVMQNTAQWLLKGPASSSGDGSASEPEQINQPEKETAETATAPRDGQVGKDQTNYWPWIAGAAGAVLLAGASIGALVTLGRRSKRRRKPRRQYSTGPSFKDF